ncbi:hypothetical protein Y032_0481g2262 [Ancylostoma ceylanicum]|uniref:G-protein coupled receptors family 1 profile domain-containing protein n=1 Tax=Ancylostoma ceylanicum TaxID=53326 RepID=A0A016WXL6_9BILA|nr:hypothetical protein Y032_0481g2262 [Ancylostoma ceylanicum]
MFPSIPFSITSQEGRNLFTANVSKVSTAGQGHGGDVYMLTKESRGPQRSIPFWILFLVNSVAVALVMVCNAIVLCILSLHRRTFFQPFYKIIYVFALSIVLDGLSTLIFHILAAGEMPMQTLLSFAIDLFLSYNSIILVFLLSLNRLAVFTIRSIDELLFKGSRVWFTLGGAASFSLGLIALLLFSSAYQRDYNEQEYSMDDSVVRIQLISAVNTVFYSIPLLSGLLYGVVFLSLRSTRRNIKFKPTLSAISRAEKAILKQGILIMGTYLAAFLLHILLQFNPPISKFLLRFFRSLLGLCPQFGIPLFVILGSSDMRNIIRALIRKTTTQKQLFIKS